MHFPRSLKTAPIAWLVLALAFSSHARSQVDGRIAGSAHGDFDIVVEVYRKGPLPDAKARLERTIQMAKVRVIDGDFSVSVDTGVEEQGKGDITFAILYRPFESNQPFRPAEVSRVEVAAL